MYLCGYIIAFFTITGYYGYTGIAIDNQMNLELELCFPNYAFNCIKCIERVHQCMKKFLSCLLKYVPNDLTIFSSGICGVLQYSFSTRQPFRMFWNISVHS